MNRIRQPSPALIVAMLALVAALAGTAIAGPNASTSAITKKKVKKIATKQINKLAPGLSVANADNATNAQNAENAENAQNATNAANATNAQNATNADALDGQDAADFTGADELHTSGRALVNDPTPGDTGGQNAILITPGAFSVEGDCFDDHPSIGDAAAVRLRGPSGSSISGVRSTDATQNVNIGSTSNVSIGLAEGTEVRSLHVTAVAPNGQVVSIGFSAEVGDSAGDCVFGATAIGP